MLREFGEGVGLFFRGLREWARSPKLMLLGALPALLVGILVLAAVILIATWLPSIVETLTPFADDWDEPWRGGFRVAAAVALFLGLVLLAVATFTALTLAVGDPFYERIWLAVQERAGGYTPAPDTGFWASLWRGIASGLRLLVPSILVGLLVFAVGLIPVAGGVAAIVVGAMLGGRLLSRELLGRPFDGRGIDARRQKQLIGSSRAKVTGFGAVAYVLFLLPLGAVFAMPAAVAGATLLARELTGEALRGPETDAGSAGPAGGQEGGA